MRARPALVAGVALGACVGPATSGKQATGWGTGDSPTADSGSSGGGGSDTGRRRWPGPGCCPGEGDLLPSDAARTVDVIVVGAGPAGLAAAIAASDAGAAVWLLEREDAVGGAARWAGGLFLLPGTPEQDAAGVEDGPARLLSDWSGMTGGGALRPWVHALADRAVPDVRDWLVDHGAVFELQAVDEIGATARRVHRMQGGGPALVSLLAGQVPEDAVMLSTPATGLAPGDDGGWVVWVDEGDGPEALTGRSVVLATGGFLRDMERVRSVWPDTPLDGLGWAAAPSADGAGHALAQGVGAVLDNPGAIGVYAHGIPDPRSAGEELLLSPLDAGIFVDQAGRRFVNEGASHTLQNGQVQLDLPGAAAWVVFDEHLRRSLRVADPMRVPGEAEVDPDLDWLIADGIITRADSATALAAAVGIDPPGLEAELAAYNERAELGIVDPIRGGVAPRPLHGDPLYAVPLQAVLAKNFGGMAVDELGAMVDAAGQPIPGLFAAGELSGMAGGSLVGDTGFAGSLTAVVLSGRIAGAGAAGWALGGDTGR